MLFAYNKKYPLILNSLERPFRFDTLEREVEIDGLRSDNALTLWSWCLYEISLRGHAPFGPSVSSVRVEDNKMTIVAKQGFSLKAEFEKCYIFEDDNVLVENEILENTEPFFRVFDWMSVRTGTTHSFEFLNTKDNFIKNIYFYKSDRIDGNHNKKDLVAVSYLKESQLYDFDYSDTMARFKVQKIMKDNGIIGARSGLTSDGKQRKYNIRVEPTHRHLVNINKKKYRDTENVKFLNLTERQVLAC